MENNKIIVDLEGAHMFMFLRYIDMIRARMPESDETKWLIKLCYTGYSLKNVDKMSRWVGFVQGILFSKHVLSIEEERIYSRSIYKPLYEEFGMDATTVEVTTNVN